CPLRCPLIMRERRDNAIDVRLVLGFGVPHEGTVGEVDSVAHVENGLPEGGYLLALTNRVSGNECDLAAVPIEELCSGSVPTGHEIKNPASLTKDARPVFLLFRVETGITYEWWVADDVITVFGRHDISPIDTESISVNDLWSFLN